MSTGLFADEEDGYNIEEETKYKLKLGDESPAPAGDEESLDDFEDVDADIDADIDADVEGDSNDKPFDDEPFDAGVEADEDEDPENFIQQLAGKLGQSLRKYTEQQGQPDFDLEKFAINSVVSATHTAEMDKEDQKDIINKIKSSGKGEDDIDVDVDVDTGDADDDIDADVDTNPTNGEEDLGFDEEPQEENFKLAEQSNPCWDGYEMVGTKKKDGKEVPNCVPKNESKQLGESLDSNINFSNFVRKDNILKKLKEHHDMDYKNYGKYDRDEYMLDGPDVTEAPEIKPAPTKPDTKPDTKPSRRQKPFRPTTKPKVNPKADDGESLIMGEGEASNGKIIKTKYLDDSRAILKVSFEDGNKDIVFNKTDEVLVKPEAYDEPWVYAYESVDSPDGKTYRVGVEFFGNPETNLELSDIHDDYIESV
jgi:hypothetical protein